MSTHINCQLCNEALHEVFIDGRTTVGVWAIMCETCHRLFGVGFGIGCGSMHRLSDGRKVPPSTRKSNAA